MHLKLTCPSDLIGARLVDVETGKDVIPDFQGFRYETLPDGGVEVTLTIRSYPGFKDRPGHTYIELEGEIGAPVTTPPPGPPASA